MSRIRYTKLSELEGDPPLNSDEMTQDSPRLRKFIRGNYAPPSESGMENDGGMYGGGSLNGGSNPNGSNPLGLSPQMMQQMMQQMQQRPISCIEISEHISQCPICSKFYSPDNTIYIVLIVILVVLCLMMLKRIVNL